MAETMGRIHKLLFVFLQNARGLYPCSSLMQRILDFQPLTDFYFSAIIYGFVLAAKLSTK